MSIHDSEFYYCEFCGCRTNAKQRACCAKGRRADRHERGTMIKEQDWLDEKGYELVGCVVGLGKKEVRWCGETWSLPEENGKVKKIKAAMLTDLLRESQDDEEKGFPTLMEDFKFSCVYGSLEGEWSHRPPLNTWSVQEADRAEWEGMIYAGTMHLPETSYQWVVREAQGPSKEELLEKVAELEEENKKLKELNAELRERAGCPVCGTSDLWNR